MSAFQMMILKILFDLYLYLNADLSIKPNNKTYDIGRQAGNMFIGLQWSPVVS